MKSSWATDIRLRAERKAGELLKEMAERGERRVQSSGRAPEVSQAATFTDLGVSRMQSSRWLACGAAPFQGGYEYLTLSRLK